MHEQWLLLFENSEFTCRDLDWWTENCGEWCLCYKIFESDDFTRVGCRRVSLESEECWWAERLQGPCLSGVDGAIICALRKKVKTGIRNEYLPQWLHIQHYHFAAVFVCC